MKNKKLVIFLIVLQLVILAGATLYWKYGRQSTNPNTAATSTGKVYYVSPTGNDGNAGTSSAPFATFTKANAVLQPGDTLLLYGGTYNQKMRITVSGTANMRITIKPVTGQTPIVDVNYLQNPAVDIAGSYIDISGFTVKNSSSICHRISGSYNTSSDMTITGCTSHGTLVDGKNILVQRHTIYGTNLENKTRLQSNSWGSGLKVAEGADTVTFSNNTVYNNYGEGIASTQGKNVTISDNFVYDNYNVNIYVDNSHNVVVERNLVTCTSNPNYTTDGNRPQGIYFGMEQYTGWGDQFYNVTVRNNTVAYCSHGVMFYSSEVPNGGLDRVYIYNNTFWGSTSTAVSLYPSKTGGVNNNVGTVIANNIIQQPQNKLSWVTDPSGMSFHHNYWVGATPEVNVRGTGDIYGGDVKLATTPVWNDRNSFKLASNSPAIDKGTTIAGMTNDAYGLPRPYNAVFDIGAHEYRPAGAPTGTVTTSPTTTVTTAPTTSTTPLATSTPTPTPSVVSEMPETLKKVYFTFAKYRYNKYVSPAKLREGDMMYFKNYNPNQLKLLQVFLYDYEKRGNQGFTNSKVTTYSRYVRTNYLLPTGKRYAYVAKFQDRATGIIATKYFVVYTTTTWLGKSTL